MTQFAGDKAKFREFAAQVPESGTALHRITRLADAATQLSPAVSTRTRDGKLFWEEIAEVYRLLPVRALTASA